MMLSNTATIIENVANAKQLPAAGAFSLALPMKVSNATEAPVRLVGFCR